MQFIEIIKIGERLTQHDFFNLHPRVQFPQPLADVDLERVGARLVPETPGPAPVPNEVPRWAGVLALKRHALVGGELVLLDPSDAGDASLYSTVLAYRAVMPAGEARDRLDVALNDAKDWLRASPTVLSMCQALVLNHSQADALFVWAEAQVGTV